MGVAGWWVAVRSQRGLYQEGLPGQKPQADGTSTYLPGIPAPHGWKNGLLEGLGGLRPWFWEHLWRVLAG